MRGDLVWRAVVRWLVRRLPPAHAASTLGDLAEDYAGQRARVGGALARAWLVREARSLARGYRRARPRARVMLQGAHV